MDLCGEQVVKEWFFSKLQSDLITFLPNPYNVFLLPKDSQFPLEIVPYVQKKWFGPALSTMAKFISVLKFPLWPTCFLSGLFIYRE